MNFLSLFVLIPILMLGGLFLSRNMKQIRWVAATGASLLLVLSVVLTFLFLGERAAGNDAEMLFMAEMPWFTPLNINYSVGVDGISVAMLLLSSVIVFTGVFASWKIDPLPKEFFLWFCLLSTGVYGFFISIDLFTMFLFYEVALIVLICDNPITKCKTDMLIFFSSSFVIPPFSMLANTARDSSFSSWRMIV